MPKDKWEYIENTEDIRERFNNKDGTYRIIGIDTGEYAGGQQIIFYKTGVNTEDRENWDEYFAWYVENLTLFAEIFRSHFVPDLPLFVVPEAEEVPDEKVEAQRDTDFDGKTEHRISSEDLLTLQKIVQDLQLLLAKYEN